MKSLQPFISPAFVPMEEPPPAAPLPLIDVVLCEGKFCKLPDHVIPEGMQVYDITIKDRKMKLCRHCLSALGEPINGRASIFGNNSMYANGFHS